MARELVEVGKCKEQIEQFWRQLFRVFSRLPKVVRDLSNHLLHGLVDVTLTCGPMIPGVREQLSLPSYDPFICHRNRKGLIRLVHHKIAH